MATQAKHHARFHAAVLRNLFPSTPACPTSSNSPPPDLPILIQPENDISEEDAITRISQSEDENKMSHPSRCQRKKQKIKRLKEKRHETMHHRSRRFIGPLQPEIQLGFEKESADTEDYISTDNSQQQKNIFNDSLASGGEGEASGDLSTEKGQDSLSRTKRRRLAKQKHFENLPRLICIFPWIVI